MPRNVTRRAALAGAATLPVAVMTKGDLMERIGAILQHGERRRSAEPHPDAELLAAWEAFIQANRDFERAYAAMPNGGKEKDHEPYYRVIDFHRERIERLPAFTPAGVAVKLRHLLAANMECMASFDTAVYGEPVSATLAGSFDEDYRYAMMWRLIQDVERMATTA